MTISQRIAVVIVLAVSFPANAADKHKKGSDRGMLEKMEAVPCGAKQRGITGLGSIFASAGIEAVNSEEKLCPQYLLRTDEMEYHIRPVDKKHAPLLPIGREGEFKIKKDHMYLKVPDGDHKKRAYQVIGKRPEEGFPPDLTNRHPAAKRDHDRNRNRVGKEVRKSSHQQKQRRIVPEERLR